MRLATLLVDQDLVEAEAMAALIRTQSSELPRRSLGQILVSSGSLDFDTIYAEGQRRYMESFSAYARSFIGNLERPDVDKINGLSPVISIEQKTTSRNPRSTVGTMTEIYDFLRKPHDTYTTSALTSKVRSTKYCKVLILLGMRWVL